MLLFFLEVVPYFLYFIIHCSLSILLRWPLLIKMRFSKYIPSRGAAKKCLIVAWWKQVSQANFAYFCHKNHQLQIKQFMAVCHCRSCSPFTMVVLMILFFISFQSLQSEAFTECNRIWSGIKKIRMMLMLSISNHPQLEWPISWFCLGNDLLCINFIGFLC